MRTSIAYFAGAGTIVAAIAAGLGGGVLMANIMNPHEAREVSRLEQRRAAPQQAQQSPQPNSQQGTPSTASNEPQAPTPYLAATQQAATKPVVVAPAPSNSPQPSSEASNAALPKERPKETAAANEPSAQTAPSTKPADASVSKQREKPQEKPQEQASTQPAAREDQASSPDNAYARARDADVKRQAAEQRKAGRRQQWTARRQQRDQEMRDVEQKVREDSDPREVIVQRDDSDRPRNFGGPTRVEFPHINLFGPD